MINNSRDDWQKKRILLAIPVYNEEKFLPELLQNLTRSVPLEHLLFVNDGSQDRSQEILDRFQVPYIRHTENLGKGAALLHAIAFAKKNNFEWLITMDGDGQHDPAHLPQFLKVIDAHHADMILGCREQRRSNMPWSRRMSNGITSIVISLLIGRIRIHDSQCGYRALRLKNIHIGDYREGGFQFESELLLHLGKNHRIIEIPIKTLYGSEKSKIHGLSDTLKFIRLVMRYMWRYA